MRQIALDTETTGISHEAGHRIIEIGCVELIDRVLTGKTFHAYLNPQREVDPGAFRVHGISNHFLEDKPLFANIVDDLIEFIKDSELIIHNAVFDVGFLNAELTKISWEKNISSYCRVLDTLHLAREKHPGQRASLDALCKRYGIDNSNRQLHGALLDAQLLALVYLALTGGQGSLFDSASNQEEEKPLETFKALETISAIIQPSEEELTKHKNFIDYIIKQSGVNMWEEV